jgi:hypothetical protein
MDVFENPILFENPLTQNEKIVTGVAVVAAIAGIWWWYSSSPVTTTLSPGGSFTIAPAAGKTFILALPTGGTWTGAVYTPPTGLPSVQPVTAGSTAPATFTYPGGKGTFVASWNDASGNPQIATLTFST